MCFDVTTKQSVRTSPCHAEFAESHRQSRTVGTAVKELIGIYRTHSPVLDALRHRSPGRQTAAALEAYAGTCGYACISRAESVAKFARIHSRLSFGGSLRCAR